MVIMENYYPQDKCQELWLKIEQLHLSYLGMEESPEKITHRAKLEECIADFLFLAPHISKFVFTETEDVLYRSAAFKKDFSGYKAATGWNALQIYAANLLTQPWRKEYRLIKTYCGFYKHQIEANLVRAETMFEAMGYKHVGNGVLVLEGPICPDKVSNVSKDCIVAYVECQILKHIWEEISSQFNISWLDILEYRSTYSGTIDSCIKNIKYKLNASKQQQFQHGPPSRTSRVTSELYDPPTSPSSIQLPHLPPPNYHHHVALPQVVPYCLPHTNGCINPYPTTYGYTTTYPIPVPIVKPPSVNGYFYPPQMVPAPVAYPVPTAQLIELDSRNGYDLVDDGGMARARRSNGGLEGDRGVIKGEELARNGVMGEEQQPAAAEAEESWEYVFRDLKRQGYSKDLGERGDVLGLHVGDKPRIIKHSTKEPKKVKATNLDEAMNSLTVSERPLKMTEALEQMEKKPTLTEPKERRHSQGSSYENVETAKPRPSAIKPANENAPSLLVKNVTEIKQAKEKAPPSSSKWECKSCTYLNDLSKDICEICSKSRYLGQDQPMEVGGPECSKCTLVNSRSAKVCQVCGASLKNSPTYI